MKLTAAQKTKTATSVCWIIGLILAGLFAYMVYVLFFEGPRIHDDPVMLKIRLMMISGAMVFWPLLIASLRVVYLWGKGDARCRSRAYLIRLAVISGGVGLALSLISTLIARSL